MARISDNSPLNGSSGRIGNLITYNLKGTQVIRSLPSTRKKRKVSQLQEIHRYAFKEMHRFAKTVKRQIIDRIWVHIPVTGGLNAYNLFIKTNRTAFGQGETIVFPELLVISQGNLFPAQDFMVKKEENGIQFNWNNKYSGKFTRPSDRLNIVVLAPERSQLIIIDIQATREEGIASIPFPESIEYTEGYAFWSSQDDLSFSPSVYWRV